MEPIENKNGSNCIFIIADHLRYDVLLKGYTPNIDRLVQDSVYFPETYCSCPLCVPARGGIFTGTYPAHNKSRINGWLQAENQYSKVTSEIENLYDVMERMDMECLHSGKQHLFVEGEALEQRKDSKTAWLTTEQTYREFVKEHGKRLPGGPGFRTAVPEMKDGVHTRVASYSNASTGIYEEGEAYYFDNYFTDKALEQLQYYDRKRPLFLSMMYLAPHPPFEIPEPWYSMIRQEEVDLPENVGIWYPGQSPLQKYNITGVIGNQYNLAQWKESWRVYLGLVALLDDCVGKIIQELKKNGLYDNSLIVFSSDHGEMLGSHALFQKMCMYEESVRIPLSIHVPGGVNAGKVVEHPVSHIDIFPTICDWYGVVPCHQIDGTTLKDCLTGEEQGTERPVYIQYDGNSSRGNYQRCIIWNHHKLVVDIFKNEIYYELYDLENDPLETTNLLFEEPGKTPVRELWEMLYTHMSEIGDDLQLEEMNLETFLRNYQKG